MKYSFANLRTALLHAYNHTLTFTKLATYSASVIQSINQSIICCGAMQLLSPILAVLGYESFYAPLDMLLGRMQFKFNYAQLQ